MLPRLVGIVLDDGAVVIVVMRFAMRVQKRMRDFFCIRKRGGLPGKGECLPEHGEQQKNKGELAAHCPPV